MPWAVDILKYHLIYHDWRWAWFSSHRSSVLIKGDTGVVTCAQPRLSHSRHYHRPPHHLHHFCISKYSHDSCTQGAASVTHCINQKSEKHRRLCTWFWNSKSRLKLREKRIVKKSEKKRQNLEGREKGIDENITHLPPTACSSSLPGWLSGVFLPCLRITSPPSPVGLHPLYPTPLSTLLSRTPLALNRWTTSANLTAGWMRELHVPTPVVPSAPQSLQPFSR